MKNNIKTFSIADLEMFKNDDSPDFAMAKVYFISDGNNSQNCPISTEVLRRDAHTALGKFIVAKYHEYTGDVGTHELDETIVGFVPPNSEITFESKDGKLFAICEAVISKIYATQVFNLFKEVNNRAVSSEFSCTQDNPNEFGEGEITSFNIHGITVLGKSVLPSVDGADIKIMKFSKDKAENYYDTHNSVNELKKFAEERRKSMEQEILKVNKTKLKDTPWGDIDKTKLRNDIMDSKNKSSLVNDVYLLVEDGWEDSPSEHLKYPVMQLIGDTLYYNRGGLSSALGYAKAENESSVVGKVEKLYNKFDINENDGKDDTKKMADIQGREAWGEIIKKVESHEKGAYVESIDDKKGQIIYTKDDVKYVVKADIKVGKDDKTIDAEIHWDTVKKDADQKEFTDTSDKKDKEEAKDVSKEKSSDTKDKKDVKDGKGEDEKAQEFADKKEEDVKKMSLDVNVDSGAMFAMLENETEEYKEMINKLYEGKDMNIIMGKVLSLAKENSELREKEAKRMAQDKEFEVNKIMADVKEDLDEKEFKSLKEEGMACEFASIKGFADKVMAFAYKKTKGVSRKEEDDGIMRFSANVETKQEQDNVFDKILNS